MCVSRYTFWHSRIGEIRLFVLLELASGFCNPFCHSADSLVCVAEDAALVVERAVDLLGAGEDLLQSQADFINGGECRDLTAARDIYKDGQHYDDGQTDKQDRKRSEERRVG